MTETTNALISAFPLPPAEYYRNYSNELVNAGFAPEPPSVFTDSYDSFGVRMNENDPIVRPLESQGIERLYEKSADDSEDLYKATRDYRYELPNAPQSPAREEKLNDLTVIFLNMHHLINCMRPHQATETIRVMLESQKRQRYDAVHRFQLHIERVVKVLNYELYDNVSSDDKTAVCPMEEESPFGKETTTTIDKTTITHVSPGRKSHENDDEDDDSDVLSFLCELADRHVTEYSQSNSMN